MKPQTESEYYGCLADTIDPGVDGNKIMTVLGLPPMSGSDFVQECRKHRLLVGSMAFCELQAKALKLSMADPLTAVAVLAESCFAYGVLYGRNQEQQPAEVGEKDYPESTIE